MKSKHKYILLLFVTFTVYMSLNIEVIINSNFVADDIIVLYMSKADPFPVFNHWTESLHGYYDIPNRPGYFYRPVHSLMMYFTTLMFGHNPVYFTLFSLILQFFNFLIIVRILNLIGRAHDILQKSYLFFLSLLFLFYPPNFVNTSWISGRVDVMLMTFLFLSFYFSLMYTEKGRKLYLIYSITFFLLALLTKDNAILFIIPEFAILYLSPYSACINKENRKKLLFFKVLLSFLYLIFRVLILKIYPALDQGDLKLPDLFVLIPRSLIEFITPVDSGVLVNLAGEYGILIFVLLILYFLIFTFIPVARLISAQNKIKMLIVLLLIPLSTFIFYYFRGGISFRFYSSTFAFWLTGMAAFSGSKKPERFLLNALENSALKLVLIVFILGSYFVVTSWSKSFIESVDFYNQLEKFSNGNEIVLLNYPHSLNNTYSYSDLNYALGFYKTGLFEKCSNVVQGASMSAYYPTDYKSARIACNKLCDTVFVLKAESVNTYFYPLPFYNESVNPGNRIGISGNIGFIPQNKVALFPAFQKTKTDSVKLTFNKGSAERKYLYYTEGELIEVK